MTGACWARLGWNILAIRAGLTSKTGLTLKAGLTTGTCWANLGWSDNRACWANLTTRPAELDGLIWSRQGKKDGQSQYGSGIEDTELK